MKKQNRFISAVLLFALICMLFTGCTPSAEPIHLTLVAAWQSNQPAPSLNLIDDALKAVASSFGSVSFIRLDGKPSQVDTLTIPSQKLVSKKQLDRIASDQVAQMQAEASQIVALERESDLLSALRLAGRLAEKKPGQTNELIVFSNGINTVAPLDMSTCILQNLDIYSVIEELQAQQAIPDLSGYNTVKIYQIGETRAPQDALTPADITALKALWRGILLAGGLTEEQIEFPDDPPVETTEKMNLPPVKTVTVLQPENGIKKGLNQTFDEETLAFVPNTATLADPAAAKEALQPLASIFQSSPSTTALVVGQTATWGEAESCRELSQRRAETIVALLAELGVSPAQLTAIGTGYDPQNPLHTNDLDDNGALMEEKAKKNRAVTVLDSATPLGQEILKLYS